MVDATVGVGGNSKYQGLGAAVRDVCGQDLPWSEINAIASRAAYEKLGTSNPNNVPPGKYNITCSAGGRGYVGNTDSSRPVVRFDRQQPTNDYASPGDSLMLMFGVSRDGIQRARKNAQDAAFDFTNFQRQALSTGRDSDIKLANGTKISSSKAVPSPKVRINGRIENVKVIVALKQNLTYIYNDDGSLKEIFQNGSGRNGLETRPGIRRVTGRGYERFPYADGERAQENYKEGMSPYGPFVIPNDEIDPESGSFIRHSPQLLHGTTMRGLKWGKVSHGCIRHDNNDIYIIKDEVRRGDYINIIEDLNTATPAPQKRQREKRNFFDRVFGD